MFIGMIVLGILGVPGVGLASRSSSSSELERKEEHAGITQNYELPLRFAWVLEEVSGKPIQSDTVKALVSNLNLNAANSLLQQNGSKGEYIAETDNGYAIFNQRGDPLFNLTEGEIQRIAAYLASDQSKNALREYVLPDRFAQKLKESAGVQNAFDYLTDQPLPQDLFNQLLTQVTEELQKERPQEKIVKKGSRYCISGLRGLSCRHELSEIDIKQLGAYLIPEHPFVSIIKTVKPSYLTERLPQELEEVIFGYHDIAQKDLALINDALHQDIKKKLQNLQRKKTANKTESEHLELEKEKLRNALYSAVLADGTMIDMTQLYRAHILKEHTKNVISAQFSPDGKYVVIASIDGTARIWDANTGDELKQFIGHTLWPFTAQFSPDGKYVVTASVDRTARIWDAGTGNELKQLIGHTAPVNSAQFSPDGKYVVTASADGTARIWDASTGNELKQLIGHTSWVRSAQFSPDGKYVVTASADGTAGIWDVATGNELTQLIGHTASVQTAQFSPNGKYVVTASADDTARIWDVATGNELTQLIGHTASVQTAQFSPNGKYVVTASADGTDRIWDANTGNELTQLIGHADLVRTAQFSPDGKYVVTTSHDKTARIWKFKVVGHIPVADLLGYLAHVQKNIASEIKESAQNMAIEEVQPHKPDKKRRYTSDSEKNEKSDSEENENMVIEEAQPLQRGKQEPH